MVDRMSGQDEKPGEKSDLKSDKVFGNLQCARCGALYPHERREESYPVRFPCPNCEKVFHRSEIVTGVIKALKQ